MQKYIWSLTALEKTSFHSTSLHPNRETAIEGIWEILKSEGHAEESIETWKREYSDADEIWIEAARFEFFISWHNAPSEVNLNHEDTQESSTRLKEGQSVVYIGKQPQRQETNAYAYIVNGSKGEIIHIINDEQVIVQFGAGAFTILPDELAPNPEEQAENRQAENYHPYILICEDTQAGYLVYAPEDMSQSLAAAKAFIQYLKTQQLSPEQYTRLVKDYGDQPENSPLDFIDYLTEANDDEANRFGFFRIAQPETIIRLV
jgi:hypothetical protein